MLFFVKIEVSNLDENLEDYISFVFKMSLVGNLYEDLRGYFK